MAKDKKPTKNSSEALKKGIQKLKSPVFIMMIGTVLLLSGLFLFGAIISYFFSWQNDYSTHDRGFWESLQNDIPIRNALGKIGAVAAHKLVFMGYGIAGFLIPFYLMQWGFRIVLKLRLKPMWRISGEVLFFLLWLPATFAYILPDSLDLLYGANGYFLNQWLLKLVGPVGNGILLSTIILIYLIARFKFTAEKLKTWLAKWKKDENEQESGLKDHFEQTVEPVEIPKPIVEVKTKNEPEESETSIDLSDDSENDEPVQKNQQEISLQMDEPVAEEKTIDSETDEKTLEVEQVEEDQELDKKEIDKKLQEFGEYDPKLDLSRFKLPTIDLLKKYSTGNITIDQDELEENKRKIVETLGNYNIEISRIKATIGPTVTLYEIVPAAGIRISKIKNLEDDIALSLAALGIRIIAPIPGKGTIGIEVPNQNPQIVSMRNLLASEKFQNSDMELPLALGKTISNETFTYDLAKMPHLLMAGATGQGKSVGLNVILTSLLYKKHPSQVKFVLVDPKKVELTLFNKIERHYLAKLPGDEDAIITDVKKVIYTLNSLCIEMDDRYELLKNAFVRNIKEYNTKFIKRKLNPEEGHRYLPYIVLVVDEFADLIMTAGKEVETPIARLAQLARAIGIHLIIATQRPSVNVITGTIKANFPARIAFRVTSKIDSRTILDTGGADQLIGKGDMLMSTGNDLVRIQCAFVDTPEIEDITEYIGNQQAYPQAYLLPEYVGEEGEGGAGDVDLSDRDARFEEAARIIVTYQQGSASLLQRKLKLGYNRAGRIVDQLEAAGIIGPFEGSKARQVLISDEASLEQLLENMK